MSVYLYDEALLNKLQDWTAGTQVTIYSPNDTKRLFETIADTSNDKPIQLPIICLRRKPSYTVLNPNKKPLTYQGLSTEYNATAGNSLNAIPIMLNYQIDVYTRYLQEGDEYTRNLIFNIVNYPVVRIIIPYNSIDWEHTSNIRLNPDIADNSDIPERLISGQFTRFTIDINIDDAYLWDVPVRDIYTITDDVLPTDKD